jgi:hypothetical protein
MSTGATSQPAQPPPPTPTVHEATFVPGGVRRGAVITEAEAVGGARQASRRLRGRWRCGSSVARSPPRPPTLSSGYRSMFLDDSRGLSFFPLAMRSEPVYPLRVAPLSATVSLGSFGIPRRECAAIWPNERLIGAIGPSKVALLLSSPKAAEPLARSFWLGASSAPLPTPGLLRQAGSPAFPGNNPGRLLTREITGPRDSRPQAPLPRVWVGPFPEPIRFRQPFVRWLERAVDEWLASQAHQA